MRGSKELCLRACGVSINREFDIFYDQYLFFFALFAMNIGMKRLLMARLKAWKQSESRKPVLLQGARQVGKTYLLEQFGNDHFQAYHRFDLAEEPALRSIFDADLRPERIVRDLGLARDIDINPTCASRSFPSSGARAAGTVSS